MLTLDAALELFKSTLSVQILQRNLVLILLWVLMHLCCHLHLLMILLKK